MRLCRKCDDKLSPNSKSLCGFHYEEYQKSLVDLKLYGNKTWGGFFRITGKDRMKESEREKYYLDLKRFEEKVARTDKERYIFSNRFLGKKVPLRELGRQLGISGERVRQLEERIADNIIKELESGKNCL